MSYRHNRSAYRLWRHRLWKREFLDNAKKVFDGKKKSKKDAVLEKEESLLKVIGQQKVEIDFLIKIYYDVGALFLKRMYYLQNLNFHSSVLLKFFF